MVEVNSNSKGHITFDIILEAPSNGHNHYHTGVYICG